MKRASLSVLSAVVIYVFAITGVYAAQAGGSFGLGVAGVPDYEGSNDYEAWPVFTGRYRWAGGQYIHIGGTPEAGRTGQVSINLMTYSRSPTWQLGPVLQYRVGRKNVEDIQVDKMENVDDAVEAGFFVGEERGPMYIGMTFVTDVSSEHKGFLFDLAGTYTKPVSDRLAVIYGASVSYANSDYMDAYFGVNAADAAKSGIPVYTANQGLKDAGLSFAAKYKPGANWGLMGFVKYNRLLSDAADSPLVDDEGENYQFTTGAGLTYSY